MRECRKCRSGCGNEPHLVAVPHRADRIEKYAALRFVVPPASQQHAHAQIETIQHQISGPQHCDQNEPQRWKKFHENVLPFYYCCGPQQYAKDNTSDDGLSPSSSWCSSANSSGIAAG